MREQQDELKLEPTPALKDELAESGEFTHHARNFLLAGGLMAGHSDGELVEEEQNYLLAVLAVFFDDPDEAIERIDSPETALELLQSSMLWLEEHGGDMRLELYRHLAAIVAADGVLDENELRYLQNVSQRLGIPGDDARDVLRQQFSNRADQE
jgi:uncharacterized tellurite resistance protein B-like protein